MSWQPYEIIFQIGSNLHIGWGKSGNLQRTRPYIIGRALWGALTQRITRNAGLYHPADYAKIGQQVDDLLALTYFYPALRLDNRITAVWPWDKQAFGSRFLSSYASTALSYPQQAAAETTLHEVEYISPYTIGTQAQNHAQPQPIFLKGYIFAQKECPIDWQSALNRLQIGGEQTYGWGRLRLVQPPRPLPAAETTLFDQGEASCQIADLSTARPQLTLASGAALLAHTHADQVDVNGELEPLTGREWRPTASKNRHIGQYIHYEGIYFQPGSRLLREPQRFQINGRGLWHRVQPSA